MQLHHCAMAVIAGAVALQGIPCQAPPGVSMIVRTPRMAVGYECEPFQCAPNVVYPSPGNALAVEIFGRATTPYVLFAGMPGSACVAIPDILGELAAGLPLFVIEVGMVWETGIFTSCGVDRASTMLMIPANAPIGAELVLQVVGWTSTDEGVAFSRAVRLIVS